MRAPPAGVAGQSQQEDPHAEGEGESRQSAGDEQGREGPVGNLLLSKVNGREAAGILDYDVGCDAERPQN